MSRLYLCLFSLSLIVLSSGCQSCNQCGANRGCGLFSGLQNQTIAPPQNYNNLGFGQNGQRSYYNTAQQPNYLINPNASAPTPAGNTSLAPQNGWRPTNVQNGSQPNAGRQNGSPVSVLANNQPPARLASLDPNATLGNNNGSGFQNNVNYQSTTTDERQDGTRIPVTDATGVRAPANVFNNPQPNRIAQAQFGTSMNPAVARPVQGQVPVLTVPGQTIVNGQIVGGQPAFFGQPHIYHPPTYTGNAPTYGGNVATYPGQFNSGGNVLAQSTATYDPRNNPNFQAGWRDRELTTDNSVRR